MNKDNIVLACFIFSIFSITVVMLLWYMFYEYRKNTKESEKYVTYIEEKNISLERKLLSIEDFIIESSDKINNQICILEAAKPIAKASNNIEWENKLNEFLVLYTDTLKILDHIQDKCKAALREK